jgi:hypothetical protein
MIIKFVRFQMACVTLVGVAITVAHIDIFSSCSCSVKEAFDGPTPLNLVCGLHGVVLAMSQHWFVGALVGSLGETRATCCDAS